MHLAAIIPRAIILNMHDAFDEPKKRHFRLVAPTAPVQLGEQEFPVVQFACIRAPLFPRLHSGVVREVEGVVAFLQRVFVALVDLEYGVFVKNP